MGIPSSAHVSATPLSRISVAQRLNSTSTAAMGWTAAARRMVEARTSLSPMPPIFPSCTYLASALTVSSVGLVRVLREVGVQQVQRLAVRRPVQFPAVPEVGARGQRGVHGGERLRLR